MELARRPLRQFVINSQPYSSSFYRRNERAVLLRVRINEKGRSGALRPQPTPCVPSGEKGIALGHCLL